MIPRGKGNQRLRLVQLDSYRLIHSNTKVLDIDSDDLYLGFLLELHMKTIIKTLWVFEWMGCVLTSLLFCECMYGIVVGGILLRYM